MTNGQIAQLQELNKCYIPKHNDDQFVYFSLSPFFRDDPLNKREKAILRRLTHQYRHQIKAMKRNRKPVE